MAVCPENVIYHVNPGYKEFNKTHFSQVVKPQKDLVEKQNDAFAKWIKMTEKRLNKRKIIKGRLYVIGVIALSVIAFAIALLIFRNFPAAIFVGLTILLIPDRILQMFEEREKVILTEQMIATIRIFAAEFIQAPHIEKGFAAVATRVSAPTGNIFANAYRDLVMGVDHELVLAKLSARLDTDHGKMFVQLIRQARIDSSINSLFPSLLKKVEKHLEMLRMNASGLTGERILTVTTALAPIPVYFVLKSILPEVDMFFVETLVGRAFLTAVFLSMFLWTIIDRIAGRVQT